jgi:peptidyl-prolyl cis-trans isomerase D
MPVMENIRQGANSPIMKLLFGAIVIVFVFWGIGGQRQTQTIATVDGTRITDTPLQKRLRAATRGQPLTPEMQANIEEQIIVGLIQEELMLSQADNMGIEVSDYEIALSIMKDPSFQDSEGVFSKKLMDQALKMNGLREDLFEADRRQRLILSKVRQSIEQGVGVTDAEVRQQFMASQTTMAVRWVMLSPDLLKDDVPVEDGAVAALLGADEDRVKSRYETEKARRWSQPRKIQYATILLRTDLSTTEGQVPEEDLRARLDKVLDEARGGSDFGDLARTWSEDLTAARGGDQGMRREDQIDADLATALVAAGADGITDIVATPRGLVIAHVQDIREAKETAFDEAKDTIARELIAEGELAGFTEALVSELLAAWQPGVPPVARLDELGLKVQDAGPFSPTQPKLIGAGSSPELVAALSQLPEVGVLGKAFTTTVGTILVEVTRVDKPSDEQYVMLKPMLQGQLLREKRDGFTLAWMQDLMDRANIDRPYRPLEDI